MMVEKIYIADKPTLDNVKSDTTELINNILVNGRYERINGSKQMERNTRETLTSINGKGIIIGYRFGGTSTDFDVYVDGKSGNTSIIYSRNGEALNGTLFLPFTNSVEVEANNRHNYANSVTCILFVLLY